MSGQDADLIRHALSTAKSQGFRYVRLRLGDTNFRAVLEEDLFEEEEEAPALAVADLFEPSPAESLHEIKATCVGYFEPNGLEVEAKLESGQSVGVIRALGITNEVTANKGGEVVEVLVQSGDPVEYGQPLAKVRLNP